VFHRLQPSLCAREIGRLDAILRAKPAHGLRQVVSDGSCNNYNGAVEAYNIRAETIPGVVVARAFGFRPVEFFAAQASDRAAVVAELGGRCGHRTGIAK
jgi:hypothetical protein